MVRRTKTRAALELTEERRQKELDECYGMTVRGRGQKASGKANKAESGQQKAVERRLWRRQSKMDGIKVPFPKVHQILLLPAVALKSDAASQLPLFCMGRMEGTEVISYFASLRKFLSIVCDLKVLIHQLLSMNTAAAASY